MDNSKKSSAMGIVLIAAATLIASEASACVTCGAPRPGRGCDQLVTLKHPDLKGPPRKKEWSKCMADPAGYNK